jgi:hypothetical protein
MSWGRRASRHLIITQPGPAVNARCGTMVRSRTTLSPVRASRSTPEGLGRDQIVCTARFRLKPYPSIRRFAAIPPSTMLTACFDRAQGMLRHPQYVCFDTAYGLLSM